jgi:hypothetical protein
MAGAGRSSGALSRRDVLPPRLLPILYFGMAHLFLVAAFAVPALDPDAVAGFFYQPRTIAVVHLITLGWISASILGALYVIGPMALRMPMPVRPRDYAGFALFSMGALGMVGHFLIAGYGGVAWSAGLVVAGLLFVGARTAGALRKAPIHTAVKLHFLLAFANVAAAGVMGLLLALHKVRPFLPGQPLSNVYAHLHLAALGWACMMVFGAGYRMIPMVLPSAMPAGRSLFSSALLLQAGTLGLFVGFLLEKRFLLPSALLVMAGFAAFFREVRFMLRNRRRPAAWLVLPDYGVWHALQSMAYAALAALLGLTLCLLSSQERALRLAAVYGVVGLVGFLAQMVLGMQARILPMFAAYHANIEATCEAPPTTPRDMGSRRTGAAVFVLWSAGVPLLAGGMFLHSARLVGAAGGVLLAAAVLGAANAAAVLRHAFGNVRPPGPRRGTYRRWRRSAGTA